MSKQTEIETGSLYPRGGNSPWGPPRLWGEPILPLSWARPIPEDRLQQEPQKDRPVK